MNARTLLVLPLALLACSRNAEPDPSPKSTPTVTSAPPPPPAQPPQNNGALPPGHPPMNGGAAMTAAPQAAGAQLAWDAPASFTKAENPSPMRKATYKAPKVGSDPEQPELAVTVAGGSVDANIDRWVGQFDESAKKSMVRSTKKLGPYEATIVELAGTFNGGGMMGGPATPKTDWAMLAAIVPVGDTSWFFKMTGPKASVQAAKKDFDAMLATLRQAS